VSTEAWGEHVHIPCILFDPCEIGETEKTMRFSKISKELPCQRQMTIKDECPLLI